MKKLILSVAIIASMASCSKNEVAESPNLSQNAMKFSNLNDNVTRAASDTHENYTVYAQYTTAADIVNVEGETWHINNQNIITAADKADAIDGDAMYLWPLDNKSLSFYAFAPTAAIGGSLTVAAVAPTAATTHGTLGLTYVVPNTTPNIANEDFTIAKSIAQTYNKTNTTTQTVAFEFNHMLSKLNIKAVLATSLRESYKLIFTKDATPAVKFTSLYSGGTIDANFAADVNGAEPEWVGPTSTKTVYSSALLIDTDAHATDVTILANGHTISIPYLIMPHAETGTGNVGTIVEIVGLSVQKIDAQGADIGVPVGVKLTHTFANGGAGITETFAKNTQYNLNFEVSTNEIIFSSKIVEWTDGGDVPLQPLA